MFKWLNWIRELNHSDWASLPEEAIVCKVYRANDDVRPLSAGLMYVPNISKQRTRILLNPNEFYFMSGLMLRYLPACRSKNEARRKRQASFALWQKTNPHFWNTEVHSDRFTLMFSWQKKKARTCFVAVTKRSTSAWLVRGSNTVWQWFLPWKTVSHQQSEVS